MMTMTRRDTLVGAIALLGELGAAEAQARSGMTGQPTLRRNEAQPGSGSRAQPVAQAEAYANSQSGQSSERSGADLVFQHDLPNITMDDWEVTVSTVDFPPGREGKVHHHAGFVLAYVLEGNVVTKISGQEERTYRPGEMFFEPPGSTHEVSSNASKSQPAKLLALIFAKKGVPLTMPGPA
jgi:quercetin dioxygenase-like cupin family protein